MKRKIALIALLAALAILMTACGNGVEGTYTVENGKIKMSFNGQVSEFDYKIEGKKMTMTLAGEGSVINLEKK